MNYNTAASGGSGTTTFAMAQGLLSYFYYNKNTMRYKSRSFYSDDDWEDMMYAEVKEKLPVLYAGSTASGTGHAFVLDGYNADSEKFHVNWGWSGSYNGYFSLTATPALTPNGTGIGGGVAGESYTASQAAVIGIKPEIITGTSTYAKVMSCNSYELSKTSAAAGASLQLTGEFVNASLTSQTFSVGVCFVNVNDDSEQIFVDTSNAWTTEMPVKTWSSPIYFNVPSTFTVGSSYYVYPAYRDENDEWKIADMGVGATTQVLTISQPSYSFSCSNYTLSNSSVAYGDKAVMKVSRLANTSGISATAMLGLKFVDADDDSKVYYVAYNEISLGEGYYYSSYFVYATLPSEFEVGKTYVVSPVFNSGDDEWCDITLTATQAAQTITVTAPADVVLSKQLAISNNGYVTTTDGKITFTLKNATGEDKTDSYILYIFKKGTTGSMASCSLGSVTLADGTEKTYELKLTDFAYNTALEEGSDYFILMHKSESQYGNEPYFYVRAANPIDYTLTSAEWGTLCLPYEAEIPDGLTAYVVTGNKGKTLIKTQAETLEMNTPYLVTGTPGTYSFSGPETPTGLYTKGLLVGNTATTCFAPKDSYVLQNLTDKDGLAFYHVAEANAQQCVQYRAYLTLPASTSATAYSSFSFIDDVTRIATVGSAEENAVRKIVKDGRIMIVTPTGTYNTTGGRIK